MNASDVISSLGGNAVVAEALGISRSALSNWKLSGRSIPPEQWIPLWCLALERGVPWAPPGGERLAALLRAGPAPSVASTDLARAA
jgi:hypothetical protein